MLVHFFVTTAGAATEDDAETTASRLQSRLSDYFTSEEGRRYHGARFPVAEVEVTGEWPLQSLRPKRPPAARPVGNG